MGRFPFECLFLCFSFLPPAIAETPFCEATRPNAKPGHSVMDLIEAKLAQSDVTPAQASKAKLVTRYMRYQGHGLGKLSVDFRISPDGDSAGKALIEVGQSYRGLEVVSLKNDDAHFRDPSGHEYHLRPNQTSFVQVLVMSETRDESAEFLAAWKSLSFAKYEELIHQDRENGWERSGHWTRERQRFLQQAAEAREDERGLVVSLSVVPKCTGEIGNSIRMEILQKDELNGGLPVLAHLSCRLEDESVGICCDDQCVPKKTEFYTSPKNPCHVIGDCDEINLDSNHLLNGKTCKESSSAGTKAGVCMNGLCTECAQLEDPCRRETGTLNDGHCEYEALPDGTICDDGKICKRAQCLSFNSALGAEDFKSNSILREYLRKELQIDEDSVVDELDPLIERTRSNLGSSSLCQRPTTSNGTTCPLTQSDLNWSGNCFDGQCLKCEPSTDLKLKSAPPCPPSLSWPGRLGKRLSCTFPDICVYLGAEPESEPSNLK